MTILSWNINGLRNKLTDFEFIAYLERFDIFSVIETWENVKSDDILNLFPNHFSIFCAAEKVSKFGRAMGGIIVFIKKQYKQFISEINCACIFSIFVTCKNLCLDMIEIYYWRLRIFHRKARLFMTTKQ